MTNALDALFRIDGKIAVVTDAGGLSSIDVAPLLATAGATVIIADKDAEASTKLAESIDAKGERAVAIPTDIESEQAVEALFAEVERRFGRCDILVNCAGLTANAPFVDESMERFDEVLSVNTRSIFMLMRAGVRLMQKVGDGGRIVNITTIGSLQPVLKGNVSYCTSRAGVTAMTRSVAHDYARDRILANLVLPGAVYGKTRFHPESQARLEAGGKLEGPATDAERRLPLGMGNGADIASAVLYLVGPAASYITGQSIVLDGGFLLT